MTNHQNQYQTVFDEIPSFYQFLSSLDRDDFVVEMIVNDLDAGATKTKVEFRRDFVRVTGNGEPVTDDGWKRLAVLQGAGMRVAHKVDGIGIKNHGMKTGFLIGDQITIDSGGRYSRQVINKNENESRPEPGAMIEPLKSFRRIQGCEVSIPYRKRGFSTGLGSGEGFSSKQIRYSDIREMYHEATSKLPLALMGIVRHGERPEYSVEISHFQLPTERISWKCSPAKSIGGRKSYVRSVITRRDGKVRFQHRERVWQTKVSSSRFVGRKIPTFFRDKRSVIIELSWAIDKNGHPIPGPDQFRYPVSFPSENTGLGISISAPWRGDTQRHTLQSDDELNDDILDLAIDELALATKLLSIPFSRARSLDFLRDNPEQIDEDRLDQYTRALVSIGGVPAVRRLELNSKGPSDGKVVGVAPSGASPLIVPIFSWESDEPPKSLVRLMPVGQVYLCPDLPEIVYDSVKTVMDSYGNRDRFITFDENDVMQRSTGTSKWFPWSSDAEAARCLAYVWHATDVIEVLTDSLNHDAVTNEEHLRLQMMLPAIDGEAHRLPMLVRSARGPDHIDGMKLNKPIATKLKDHELFRKSVWRLPDYDLDDFARAFDESTDLTDNSRHQAWIWLKNNFSELTQSDRRKFAGLHVWPDQSGDFHKIAELCLPTSRQTREIFSGQLPIPDPVIPRLPDVVIGGRSALAIRDAPTRGELQSFVSNWLENQTEEVIDNPPTSKFISLENDLATLAADKKIISSLDGAGLLGLAVNKEGNVRWSWDLVKESPEIQRLGLQDSDIAISRASTLDMIIPLAALPTPAAIARSLQDDPMNESALVLRLKALLNSNSVYTANSVEPSELQCLIVDGQILSPSEVFIKERGGNFWGDFLIPYSTSGLDAESQQILRESGVASGRKPSLADSKRFFLWLSRQDQQTRISHQAHVLRHWKENNVGLRYGNYVPTIRAGRIQYISTDAASHRGRHFYYDDFQELAKAVVDSLDGKVAIIPSSDPGVNGRVDDVWRRLNLRSLASAARRPTHYYEGRTVEVSGRGQEWVDALSSAWFFGGLSDYFAENDIHDLSWRHGYWQKRVTDIKAIRAVESLSATYKIKQHSFEIEVESAFDENSGEVMYVPRGNNELSTLSTEVVRRMSKASSPSPRWIIPVITSYLLNGRPSQQGSLLSESYPNGDRDANREDEPEDTENNIGESFPVHGARQVPPTNKLPDPGPLSPGREPGRQPSERSKRGTSNRSTGRSRSAIEDDQTAELKKDTYAAHCQVCLASSSASELAPIGSYVYDFDQRKSIIEANHADHYSAGGERGAHNLVLMCSHHHRELGDLMNRQLVREALKNESKPAQKLFELAGESIHVEGLVCTIISPARDEPFDLFFEKNHADRWIEYD